MIEILIQLAVVFIAVSVITTVVTYVLAGVLVLLLVGAIGWCLGFEEPRLVLSRGNLRPSVSWGSLRLLFTRRARRIAAVAVGTGVVGLALVDLVFPRPILSWFLARGSRSSGIEAGFQGFSGHLITGDVQLEGVTLRRAAGERSGMDLTIARVEAGLDLASLLVGERALETCRVSGVRGTFVTVPRKSGAEPGRELTIRDLRIEDVMLSVDLRRTGEESIEVVVDRLECRDFRRSLAVFDILTASSLQARIQGQKLTADIRDGGQGSLWQGKDLDVRVLGALGGGIFEWLAEGRADLRVDTRIVQNAKELKGEEGEGVLMEWKLGLTGVKVESPADRSRIKRFLAAPLVLVLNQKLEKSRELSVSLVMQKSEMRWRLSPDAAGIWDKLTDAWERFLRSPGP